MDQGELQELFDSTSLTCRGVSGLEYMDLTTESAKIAKKARFFVLSVCFAVRSYCFVSSNLPFSQ